jgi:DNA-binding CsgD family transcriptional regulator
MIGRARELSAIERFAAASADRPAALVLEGEPGIGKTTLWEAAIDAARNRQHQILAARASGAEACLSFAGLTDLLEDVDEEAFAALPAPQRRALDVALLRAVPHGDPPEQRAIGLGLLNLLRALARRGPLVVAVDDLQWLDSSSAEALVFAARRVDGEPVSLLLARRPGSPSDLERVLARDETERLNVRPLGLAATGRLLLERLGMNVRRPLLRRIVEATRGNPLFALELGRTLAEHGPPAPGEEMRVPDVVEDLLGTRVERLPEPVRRLLLAVALSADLRASQLVAIRDQAAVDDAVEAGLLVAERDHVRPSHPLLAAAAIQRSTAREQRELHVELAAVVADEELRALHLALATESPDDELAATVAAAAAAAAARGAAEEAVVLAEHALRLTAEPDERNHRVLALAEYLNVAGEQVRLTELLKPRLASLPAGEARFKAFLLLSNGVVDSNDEIVRYLERALAESGRDVRLRAIALSEIAANNATARVQKIREAEERALEAVETGRDAGPELERSALYALAWARSLRGRAVEDLCERFHEVSDAGAYLAFSPDRVACQRLAWRGDVGEARATVARLLSVADERGEPISYGLQRLHLCELELRAGAWDEAERLLDEWSREGDLLVWPCYERCRALLAAGRGLPDEAEHWAAQAIERAQRTGLYWDVLESLRARGIAALLAGDPALAEESLASVWEHIQREGVEEPGAFPVAPDLVEALVELGRLDEARGVTDRLRDLSDEREHPWGLATTRRCAALVQLASQNDGEHAATELGEAAEAYGALGLRFDRARSLLSLGRAQRRLRKWAAARESLEEAAAAFDDIGSPGWARLARSERGRVGGRRPQTNGQLTPAELRVAKLAADGLANKEIAQCLFVSVRTVEVHLKHAYAKLGIRSRTQLARHLSST